MTDKILEKAIEEARLARINGQKREEREAAREGGKRWWCVLEGKCNCGTSIRVELNHALTTMCFNCGRAYRIEITYSLDPMRAFEVLEWVEEV